MGRLSKFRDACSRCLFRAVYTGTRPGLTPAIRAGKGWRGRRELAPRCSATQLGASRWRIWTDTYVKHTVRTTTTTTETLSGLRHRSPCFWRLGRCLLRSGCIGSLQVLRLSARLMVRPCLCRAWRTGRSKVWTPPPSASSRPLRWRPDGRKRRSRRRRRSRRSRTCSCASRGTSSLLANLPWSEGQVVSRKAWSAASAAGRRSKKRKKKKLPKTSSHSSRGAGRERQLCCACRRFRQWHVLCWLCWYSLFALSPFGCCQAQMLGILASMDQEARHAVRRRRRFRLCHVQGLFCWFYASRCAPFWC